MTRILSRGATGDDVRMLQAVLNYHRQLPTDEFLAVDGDFRQKTENRVKAFQVANQLSSDGVVGPNTRKMLMTICQFSAEYVVLVDMEQMDIPVGDGPASPVTLEYELSSGIERTLELWSPPPSKPRYVLEFEAAWVVKNPGSPLSFSLALGAGLGQTISTPAPDGPYVFNGGGSVTGKYEKDFELGPIKLDWNIQAGFEAQHEIHSPHVELSSAASLATGISFTVVHERFYLFAQGELGIAVKWFPGTVQASPQWTETAGVKFTF